MMYFIHAYFMQYSPQLPKMYVTYDINAWVHLYNTKNDKIEILHSLNITFFCSVEF